MRPAAAWDRLLAMLPALLAALAYTALSVQQWRRFDFPSWDLGIFSSLASAYARGSAPIVPIKGDDFNLLGDHFHPILVLLGPVWALFPSPLTLMVLQALLLAASAVPLTRLAIDRLGRTIGLMAGFVYVFSFGLQSAHIVQFHEIAFAVPLLALSLTAYLRHRMMTAAIWAGLLVFVKEDLGLTVTVLGLIIAVRALMDARELQERSAEAGRRATTVKQLALSFGSDADIAARRDFTIGAGLTLWGVFWFLLSTLLILPALNPQGQFDYTDNIGSALDVFGPPIKWATVGLLILATGVVGLRSPLVLLALPTLAWRMTGNVEHYWGWTWHYSAVLMPIAFAALLDALPKIARFADRLRSSSPAWAHRIPRWVLQPRAAAFPLGLAALATVITGAAGPTMPVLQLAEPDRWSVSEQAQQAREAMAALPPGTQVASDISTLAPLTVDHQVQWLHGPNQRAPYCALVDQWVLNQSPAQQQVWLEDRWNTVFEQRFSNDRYSVWCQQSAPQGWERPAPASRPQSDR
ncbi:DUF2079 domain-containing protein [Helcobacillus massiliensis]|uniref:Putative membrane protein n=2 Tax=Helcobacillus massiliensis TaxID=521392 RepID=A0A839R1F8_9MICO|nr:putative membrane protein [Helcobacillus massiliensis]